MKTYLLSLFLFIGSLTMVSQSDDETLDVQEATSVIAIFEEYDGENYVFEAETEQGISTLYFANIEEDILLDFDLNTEAFEGKKFEIEYITEEFQDEDGALESTSKTIINLILK